VIPGMNERPAFCVFDDWLETSGGKYSRAFGILALRKAGVMHPIFLRKHGFVPHFMSWL